MRDYRDMHDNLEAQFVATAMRSVSDAEAWSDALGLLCQLCGAKKALIALRDRKTADFVIPDQLANAYDSPLLYGFTEDEVAAYLTTYQKVDPWTAMERANHPYEPYALSQFVSTAELRRSGLWEWLEPQGIDNTVVTELCYDADTFTTLNLYFEGAAPERSSQLKDRLNRHLPVLRNAWKVSREYALAMSRATSNSWVMDHMQEPVAIIDAEGLVIGRNSQADAELSARIGQPLTLPADVVWINADSPGAIPPKGKVAMVSTYDGAEWFTGERDRLRMVVVQNARQTPMTKREAVWDNPDLTEGERAFCRLVAEGERIRDVQSRFGISKSRSMQIWKQVREKIGVQDRTELMMLHQKSQG